jgi:hypothetical protein
LEENAKGARRGFVLVEFGNKIQNVELVEIKNTKYEIIEIDGKNRDAKSVNAELLQKTRDVDSKDKVIIIKLEGELSTGKTADIDTSTIREELADAGALTVNISKNRLSSREYKITEAKGQNKDEIETNVFKENIGEIRLKQEELKGEKGVMLAKKLLKELEQPILVNEKKSEYTLRIRKNALEILGLNPNDSQLN